MQVARMKALAYISSMFVPVDGRCADRSAGGIAAGQLWPAFVAINERRRAVRDFTGEPVADEDMRAILQSAQLAPSSSNLQPYELHWVRDPDVMTRIAAACRGQRAAATAGAFVVVVARLGGVARTWERFLRYVDGSGLYSDADRRHHAAKLFEVKLLGGRGVVPRLVHVAASSLCALAGLVTPHLLMAPFGRRGGHQWAARNSIFAAQTLLLAAVARGLDACPMEGFNPFAVARTLGLGGVVIPLVIAVGRRKEDAEVAPQWRKPFEDAVVMH